MTDKTDTTKHTSVVQVLNACLIDLDTADRLLSRLDDQMTQSYRHAMAGGNLVAQRAASARGDACLRAITIIRDAVQQGPLCWHKAKGGVLWAFKEDMSAGIIAFNEACRVLGIPAHTRTALAVKFWEEI